MTPKPGEALARLREDLTTADAEGWYEWPTRDQVVALLDIAEAAQEIVRREEASEYSSIYAAPSEFARLLKTALAALSDTQAGAE